MSATKPITLQFGYSRGIPADVRTAWGARLIAPNDLLYDRQDLVAEHQGAKAALIEWLNGDTPGNGALQKALDALGKRDRDRPGGVHLGDGEEFVVYEDDQGKIVGNTQRSGGYVYVAGWLKR